MLNPPLLNYDADEIDGVDEINLMQWWVLCNDGVIMFSRLF
jgi:hypothetical protein